jgi:hypothetical protein
MAASTCNAQAQAHLGPGVHGVQAPCLIASHKKTGSKEPVSTRSEALQ